MKCNHIGQAAADRADQAGPTAITPARTTGGAAPQSTVTAPKGTAGPSAATIYAYCPPGEAWNTVTLKCDPLLPGQAVATAPVTSADAGDIPFTVIPWVISGNGTPNGTTNGTTTGTTNGSGGGLPDPDPRPQAFPWGFLIAGAVALALWRK